MLDSLAPVVSPRDLLLSMIRNLKQYLQAKTCPNNN